MRLKHLNAARVGLTIAMTAALASAAVAETVSYKADLKASNDGRRGQRAAPFAFGGLNEKPDTRYCDPGGHHVLDGLPPLRKLRRARPCPPRSEDYWRNEACRLAPTWRTTPPRAHSSSSKRPIDISSRNIALFDLHVYPFRQYLVCVKLTTELLFVSYVP